MLNAYPRDSSIGEDFDNKLSVLVIFSKNNVTTRWINGKITAVDLGRAAETWVRIPVESLI